MVARKAEEEEDPVRRSPRAEKRSGEAEGEEPSHRTRTSAVSPKLCRLFRTVGL